VLSSSLSSGCTPPPHLVGFEPGCYCCRLRRVVLPLVILLGSNRVLSSSSSSCTPPRYLVGLHSSFPLFPASLPPSSLSFPPSSRRFPSRPPPPPSLRLGLFVWALLLLFISTLLLVLALLHHPPPPFLGPHRRLGSPSTPARPSSFASSPLAATLIHETW
jgi:hypothetical protein